MRMGGVGRFGFHWGIEHPLNPELAPESNVHSVSGLIRWINVNPMRAAGEHTFRP
jgi:hypothetical protein